MWYLKIVEVSNIDQVSFMYKYLLLLGLVISTSCLAQGFSLSDTSLVFKNSTGKVLNHEEVLAIASKNFSIRKDPNQPKVIYLIPVTKEEVSKSEEEEKKYKLKLLNSHLKEFNFKDINGKIWNSRSLRGKNIVLNFWYTHCDPCIREIPNLNKLDSEFAKNHFVFLAITFDKKKPVTEFLKAHPFHYSIVSDQNLYIEQFGVITYPTTVIIDPSGVIKFVSLGYNENIYSEIKMAIEKAK